MAARFQRICKALAATAAAAIVGAQLYVILPGGPEWTWYWPIVDYQMYATSAQAGDPIEGYQLRFSMCETRAVTDVVDSHVLGLSTRRLQILIDETELPAREHPNAFSMDRLQRLLEALAQERFPGRYCEGEIWKWTHRYAVDDPGAVPPWRPYVEWEFVGEARRG